MKFTELHNASLNDAAKNSYLYAMILITGATGLTGSHLALLLLESGQPVRATYRSEKSKFRTKSLFALHNKESLFPGIEWIKADVNDIPSLEKAFHGIDCVYHAAALISFDPADEEQLRKTNIEGTANIVNLCLAHKIKKLCHVSSIAALGDRKDFEQTVTEETDWNPEKPHSDYAISKHGAEMEVWRGQQEGLDVVIVNPGIIIGPPLWITGSSQLFRMIERGQRFYTLGTMGFIGVSDVVKIMKLLMESDISGEQFILSAENMSYRDMFFLAADAMKKPRPSAYAKPWMTSIGWRIDWLISLLGKKRLISKDQARSLHDTTHYSNAKIVTASGYKFQSVASVLAEIFAN